MRLYDMGKSEWREAEFKRGDHWRSKAIYQCSVCHTKINEWFMGGWPGTGPRIVCPGTGYEEHDKLISLLEEYEKLEKKIKNYQKLSQSDKEKKLIEDMRTEKKLLGKKIKELQELFSGKLDNVKSVGKKAKVKCFYPFAEYADKKRLRKGKD